MSESNVTSKTDNKDGEDVGVFVHSESDLTSLARENINFATKDDENRQVKMIKSSESSFPTIKSTIEKIKMPARFLQKCVDVIFHGRWKMITLNCFERFFMVYSRFVFRHSVAVIVVVTLICLFLGIGHFFRHPVEDSERQFALPNSKAKNDEKFYNSAFPGARTRHEIVIFKSMTDGSVITNENLHIMKSFHEGLMNLTFTLNEGEAKELLEAYNELRNSTSSKNRATGENHLNSTSSEEGGHLRSILEDPIIKMNSIEEYELIKRKLIPGQKFGFGAKRNFNKNKFGSSNQTNRNSTRYDSKGNLKPKEKEKHYLDIEMFTKNDYIAPQIVEEKDSSGKIVKKYKFNFSHVCARVQGGSCRRPSGILWMYKDTKDFGKPIPAPYVINTLTYQSFRTDMWLSPTGMEYENKTDYVKASRAAILEYQLSDQDKMKKFSFRWEEQFMKYCEKVQRRLQKGDYGDDLRDGSNFLAFASDLDIGSGTYTSEKNNNKKNGTEYISNDDFIYDGLDDIYITNTEKVHIKNKTGNWQSSSIPNIKRISKGATKYLFKGESSNAPLSLFFNARRALSDELTEQTYIHTLKDYAIIGSLVVILLIYGWTVGYGSNIYTSRATSGVCGAIAALLAFIGGAGLCYLAGLEHTSTASAAPFLVLGVGMDDSFVVINSFNMTYPLKNAEDRIVSAVRDCGLSISLTTLTNLLSFAIGTSAGYLAIKNFCILTFVGLLFGYITCLTILLGVLCIDARLEEKKMIKIFGREFFTNHKYPDPLVPDMVVPVEKFSTVALIGFLVSQYKHPNSKVDTQELILIENNSVKNGDSNEIEISKISSNFEDASINSPIDEEEVIDKNDKIKMLYKNKASGSEDHTRNTTYLNNSGPPSTLFSNKTSSIQSKENIFETQRQEYSNYGSEKCLENDEKIFPNNLNSLNQIDKLKDKIVNLSKSEKNNSKFNKKKNEHNKAKSENKSQEMKVIPNFADILDTRLLHYKRGRSNAHSSIQLTENIEVSDYTAEQLKRDRGMVPKSQTESLLLSSPNSEGSYISENNLQPTNSHFTPSSSSSDSTTGSSESELTIFPMETKQNIGRKSRRFVIKYYATFLTMTSTRVIIFILASIFLAISIYSSIKLKMGLDLKVLAPPSSQVYKFYVNHEQLFNKYGDVTYMMFQASQKLGDKNNNNWWDDSFIHDYKELQTKIHDSWFTEIKLDGMVAFYDSLLVKGLPKNSVEYSKMLKAFISSPYNRHFEDDFVFNQNTGELEAWRSVLIPIYLPDTSIRGKYMTDIRKIMDSVPGVKEPIAYSPLFIFYESDVSILPQTLYNMGCALIAVLLASLILMPSISSVIIVIIILCMVDVCIIGMMAQWGLQLNMLTMVNLIMSIGISVDYSTHICHCFAHCSGKDRNTRVIETLGLMGIPIFHGAMSTQFAVTVLAFSDSYVLQTFYKMMTLVVCIGICYGAIILPVILTVFGPMDVIKYTKAQHK
ncbi:patched family protein [Cryptosporidium ubiquitum]|uniref:Patched family protein n=1 Tax=Cryptosporidium ubiquitum TaxID=857276 RepID=A0A1J4MM60_9CRYT|nr:patched family protein [Cryptosporidium ubiquitum]OII73957.1 patched family protein [Cryptosporidium ubiquitum]